MRALLRFGRLGLLVSLFIVGVACEGADSSADTHQGGGQDTQSAADGTTGGEDGAVGAEDSGGGGGGGGCEEFCADMVAGCPEDDTMETCLHSCEMAAGEDGPGEAALACAAAAADCTAVRGCWGELF